MKIRGWLVAAVAAGAVTLCGCTTQALPKGPTAEDVDLYYRVVADATWTGLGFGPGVERPPIEEMTFETRETWASGVATCMNEAGFSGYSAEGGSLAVTGTGLETDEERIAGYLCQVSHQIEPVAGQVLSAQQLDYVYTYYVRFLVPCLQWRGLDVGDVPTREEFIDHGTYASWNPYWSALSRDTETMEALQTECPPMPPGIADPFG